MPEIRTAPDADPLLRQEIIDVFELNEKYVIAQVQFGQAALRCRGTGICRVDLYTNDKAQWGRNRCNHAFGKIAMTKRGLVIMFDGHGLCKILYEKYFTKHNIQLKDDLKLGNEICRKIKLSCARIPAGYYPVIHMGTKRFIVFEQT